MSEPLEPIQFTIEGSPQFGDRVPISAFLAAVEDWIAALQQIASDIAPRRTTVEWLLAEVRPGSAVVEIAPFPRTGDGASVARQVIRSTVVALNTIQRDGDPTTIVSKKAAQPLLRLVKRVDDQEVPGIQVKSGVLYTEILPRRSGDGHPRPLFYRALGSLDGEIVSVSFAAQPPSFTVRDRLDVVLVPCYFDADRLYDAVIDNLRRRVFVTGVLTRRVNGIAAFMTDVEEIQRVPARDDLPHPDDIVGIDPDFAEGMPAEVYVRRRRD